MNTNDNQDAHTQIETRKKARGDRGVFFFYPFYFFSFLLHPYRIQLHSLFSFHRLHPSISAFAHCHSRRAASSLLIPWKKNRKNARRGKGSKSQFTAKGNFRTSFFFSSLPPAKKSLLPLSFYPFPVICLFFCATSIQPLCLLNPTKRDGQLRSQYRGVVNGVFC